MRFIISSLILIMLFPLTVFPSDGEGKRLFDRFCNGCHYGGGNIIRKDKPLTRFHLKANGIDSVDALVRKIRIGGQGMPRYGADLIPEPDARRIAAYILETFQ